MGGISLASFCPRWDHIACSDIETDREASDLFLFHFGNNRYYKRCVTPPLPKMVWELRRKNTELNPFSLS